MQPQELLLTKPEGLYCPIGDFYIDPVRPVATALISHGHADHARPGHGHVYATPETHAIMDVRYGKTHAATKTHAPYGSEFTFNGVKVRFVPAGHVLGSAQIVVEKDGLRIVFSGDYKRREDATCAPFEPVKCDVFITEATFALPVFRHPDDGEEIGKLMRSIRQFPERTHLVGAYALGKAQRVISLIRATGYDEPIFIHGSMERLCQLYKDHGIALGALEPATLSKGDAKRDFRGKIVIGPPSAFADRWARRFPDPVACFASGWMRIRQRAKQRGVELPIILSDHCDWDELTATIKELSPSEVWVTHGRDDALIRWCEINQIRAKPLSIIGYEDETE